MTLPATIACITSLFCLFLAAMSLRLSRARGWNAERWTAAISAFSACLISLDIPVTMHLDGDLLIVLNSIQTVAAGALTASWIVYAQLIIRGSPIASYIKWTAIAVFASSVLVAIPGIGSTNRVVIFHVDFFNTTYRILQTTLLGQIVLMSYSVGFVWITIRFAVAWIKKTPGMSGYFTGMLILVLAAINDVLVWSGITHMPLLIDVAYVAPVVVSVLALSGRVVRESEILAELSADLEAKVHERTAKLRSAEARHRTTLASIGDGLISTDENGCVVLMNGVAENLTGWKNREAIGRPITEIFKVVNSETNEEIENPVKRVIHTGLVSGYNENTVLVAADGTERRIADSFAPIRGGKDEIVGAVIVFRDVTEEYENRCRLNRSEERYRELFSNMSDGVAVYEATDNGQDFIFRDFNQAGSKIDGIGRESVIGHRVTELFPGIVQFGLLDVFKRVYTTGVGEHMPVRKYQDGRISGWRDNYVYRLPTKEIVSVYRDITNQKKTEEEQRILETQLRQAQKLEAIGQLAAGVAHEINTPAQYIGDSLHFLSKSFEDEIGLVKKYREALKALVGASGYDELFKIMTEAENCADQEYLEENVPEAFDLARDGISRISAIVTAMKEFAHPDQKEKRPADLNHALATTLTIARNEYKYVADVESVLGDLPLVLCLVGELNQVFLNLIVNAAHAISDVVKGTNDKGTISVKSRVDGDDVIISIGDTGSGIPETIRDRVFEPFFTTKEVGRGSGQGLAIARSVVVDKHGGALTFETEKGKGSTFNIRLPIHGCMVKEASMEAT